MMYSKIQSTRGSSGSNVIPRRARPGLAGLGSEKDALLRAWITTRDSATRDFGDRSNVDPHQISKPSVRESPPKIRGLGG